MSRYESVSDLYDKLDYEGGFPEVIWGYGISWTELPEGTPDEIIAIWRDLEGREKDIRIVQGWLEDNADDGREYYDYTT